MPDPVAVTPVTDLPAPSRRRSALFVKSAGTRSRRPIDVALVVLGVLVTVGCARAAEHRGILDDAVREVADDLPGWVTTLFDGAYTLGAAYAIALVAAALITARRRGWLPLTLVVAVAAVLVGTIGASYLAGAGLPDFDPGPVRSGSPHGFPTVRVAIVTAMLLVLRPWLVLQYRRFSVAVVAVQCVAAWTIGIAGPTDVLGALALGIAAAGLALAIFGSPAGHPDLGRVSASLRDLGVGVHNLRFAARQPWGARILYADSNAGSPLLVKVYGRDATDAHRYARWWRTLLYRDQAMPDANRLQLVEHEALVTILADRAGVRVNDVVAAAESDGDAVLVLAAPPPSAAAAADVSDDDLREIWRAVGRLHQAGLCHGELTLDKIATGDGPPVLSDFSHGLVAARDSQRDQDVATLLISQAHKVGAERTVAAAIDGLGADRIAAAQPYLQLAVLPRPLRSASGVRTAISSLQTTITENTGVEPPPPAEIARLRWRDLLQNALILVAAYALLTTLAHLDWNTVIDTWRNATWAWVVVGLIVAQGTSVADSVTTMSVVNTRLPLVPLVHLQYAIKTVGLAISATVGRIALNTSLLRRFGEGPATAVTASALDSFAGGVVNVVVVLIAVLLAENLPELDLSGPDHLDRIIAFLVIALVLSVLVIVLVPTLRRRVMMIIRAGVTSLRVVTDSPQRALLLFGSNLASLLITAVAMDCMVQGLYPSLPYGEVVFVTAGAALFASLIPVPGNVGVGEAAIAAGLVAVGVPSGPAFAIAVTQRIATSYLPPVFGAYSLRWLRKEDYVD